jgi:hypothetical protein
VRATSGMGSSVFGFGWVSPAKVFRMIVAPAESAHFPGSIHSGSLPLLIQISSGGWRGAVVP